ncbi:MAG: thioredoxin-disulfide reductase [Proteobacteria bacterium]|nr:thioredoxin-disulfide reductase [Alphaproteobacteria bacterium]NCC03204.1 thioredoxin-disulfide reductase [Pseudomonadota bacterium]
MQVIHTKVLIIGAGPAGYTAAIYTARANLAPTLVQGMQPGGQLTITTDVENFPGFADPIAGPQLMENMAQQAQRVGATLLQDMIVEVDFAHRPFVCKGDSGNTYHAETVIIATGAQARWLGLESEKAFQGYGVSGCATCDGFFYRNKKVMVVGGGNSAMEEALYLAQLASEVVMVHRRDEFRGEKILRERVAKNPKIKVLWNSTIEEIKGTEAPLRGVTSAAVKNVLTGEVSDVAVDGIFIAIGHSPATAVFKGKVSMDAEGYILTKPDSTATDIPGVFAAGDVKDKTYRQAVTAAGMGCMAALEVEKYLGSIE